MAIDWNSLSPQDQADLYSGLYNDWLTNYGGASSYPYMQDIVNGTILSNKLKGSPLNKVVSSHSRTVTPGFKKLASTLFGGAPVAGDVTKTAFDDQVAGKGIGGTIKKMVPYALLAAAGVPKLNNLLGDSPSTPDATPPTDPAQAPTDPAQAPTDPAQNPIDWATNKANEISKNTGGSGNALNDIWNSFKNNSGGNNGAGYASLLAALASSQSGGSMPATPDFVGAANATAAGNLANAQKATVANRSNEVGIGGGSNWTQDPATGQWTQSQTLSQPNRAMYGQAQSNLSDVAGRNLSYSAGDPNLLQQNVTDALYNQQTRYLDPQFQQSQAALENQLANQGITRGSEAYNNAMNNANMQKEQAYGQARNSAISQGVSAAQGMFGMGLQNANLNNQAMNQGYTQNLGMMQGLQGLAPQGTQYNQSATAGADALGAAQGQATWNQGIYNAKQARQNALTTGLFNLGGQLIK